MIMFSLKKEFSEYGNKSLRLPKDLVNVVQSLADKNNMLFNKEKGKPINQGFPYNKKERETGIEPATPSLARRCSTAEPLAHFMRCSSQRRLYYHMLYFVSTTFFIFLSNFKDNRKPERFLLSPISIDINYFSAITLITTILPH